MNKIYLISEGAYSDYNVDFLVKSARVVSESEFRVYWLEAIKRKTEYVDSKLEAVAKYLGVTKQSSMYDYYHLVDGDSMSKAMKEAGYDYVGEADFFQEVLVEQGMSVLLFEEYNVDDF